jgi:hypothetical protein
MSDIFVLTFTEDYGPTIIIAAYENFKDAQHRMYKEFGIKPDKILVRSNPDEEELGGYLIENVVLIKNE